MNKISNSTKRKLKLRKSREANKDRRLRREKAGESGAFAFNISGLTRRMRMLTLSALLFLALVGAYNFWPTEQAQYFWRTNHSIEACVGKYLRTLTSPAELFTVKPAAKTISNPILYKHVGAIVKNSPMEKMTYDIARRNDTVAAFIVGIAMKESKFGKYSPKKDGKECYNYWGYRGKENTTASGYSCFKSPSHAVKVVGDKIEKIVKLGVKTPEQMISWKCGHSCAGHSPESVDKWIADVSINYYRLKNEMKLAKK